MPIVKRPKKNGSVTYQVKVTDPTGAWFPTRSFDRYEDALAEEARLVKLRRQGQRRIGDDARAVSLSEYWEVWSVENRSKVSEGWKISQNQMFRDHIAPYLGDMKLLDIGVPEIGRAMNELVAKGLGGQTRLHVYSLLRKMFGDAVDYYEMLASSPVKAKHHRPEVKDQERAFLRPEQSWHLMQAVRGTYLGPAVWIQLLAGLRISEVQALRWDSVQFENHSILIRAAWNNKVKAIQEYPKQGSWDRVPIIPSLREYLLELRGRRSLGDFVAHGPKGTMLSYETYHRALKRVCRQAGLPPMDTHELRHSATELWIRGGASEEMLKRLLNHSSADVTRRYIHRSDEMLHVIGRNILPPESMRPSPGNQERP
jgi:integrase